MGSTVDLLDLSAWLKQHKPLNSVLRVKVVCMRDTIATKTFVLLFSVF